MTENQKNRIHEMYQMGHSYKRIATNLSLKEGTVKSYCTRAVKKGILTPVKQKQQGFCKQCGKELVQIEKRKTKTFCCNTCRQKWWNSHQYMVKPSSKALYHFTCPTCRKPFSVYGNANRTYCSHACYIKARYYKESSSE